jgi:hypothetical protein
MEAYSQQVKHDDAYKFHTFRNAWRMQYRIFGTVVLYAFIMKQCLIHLLFGKAPRAGLVTAAAISLFSFGSCSFAESDDDKPARKGTYVSPSVDSRGRVRKGHYRKAYSTDKNAVRNRARSRYYYETRGKYKKKD